VIPVAIYIIIWIRKNAEFGWTSDKIRNLLMYKQLTKTPLTPLENEILTKKFGKHERRQIILSHDRKKQVLRKVYLIDVLAIFLLLTIIPTNPLLKPRLPMNPSTNEIQKFTGQIIALEYRFSTTLLGTPTASPTETVIHFHNLSVKIFGDIRLELGQNYTITINTKTHQCAAITRLQQ